MFVEHRITNSEHEVRIRQLELRATQNEQKFEGLKKIAITIMVLGATTILLTLIVLILVLISLIWN